MDLLVKCLYCRTIRTKAKSLITIIFEWDNQILEWIHQQGHPSWLNTVMPVWRDKETWIPLYIFIGLWTIWRHRSRGLLLLITAGLTIAVADTLSSKIIKPMVRRLRPCNDPQIQEALDVLVHCGSGYSFTSSHATNHFALAVFLWVAFRGIWPLWLRWTMLVWAATIAFGQVYVGVHYPTDILGGALLGSLIGWLAGWTFRHFVRLDPKDKHV